MLFSAGMGIGLVFWGAAEPLSHFASSSPEAEVGSSEALRDAFRYSFFHWGISAWVIYGLVAAALAYFRFRKKEKTLISVTLKPLFGDRMNGIAGNIVDAITIFATVVGVGTSLGMGAVQINGGLSHLFGMPSNLAIQLVIIAVATALFLASALSGLSRGVKLLSNLNVVLAIVLVAVCIVIGPTTKVFDALVTAIGDYTQNFPSMSLSVSPYDTTHQSWIRGWTIFYWSWWIAWSPFVGVFIARISRGRSIRQFLLGVILIPTVFSCIWFATFGTLSTSAQINGADLASLPTESVLFGTLAQYPLERPLSILSVLLIISFFVTSADSATFVLGMISEDGNLDPHKRTKVIWGLLLSVLGAVLLMVGGLDALQNVLIITALPFSVIILLMVLALFRELNHERLMMGLYIRPTAFPEQDKPFRSYEDDPPIEPVELMQRDIELMQRLRPDEGTRRSATTRRSNRTPPRTPGGPDGRDRPPCPRARRGGLLETLAAASRSVVPPGAARWLGSTGAADCSWVRNRPRPHDDDSGPGRRPGADGVRGPDDPADPPAGAGAQPWTGTTST